MPRYDFHGPRLYVSGALKAGEEAALGGGAMHYLRNVLRLDAGAKLLVFNGRDGEWQAQLSAPSKREIRIEILSQTRPQPPASPLHYAFAPVKHARLDFMVQKAVELGAGRLTPVVTQHTQVSRVNAERMRANVVEAAEQCGVLAMPEVEEAIAFPRWLAGIESRRVIVFCDEDASIADPLRVLEQAPAGPLTLIVGPEGGFGEEERKTLLARERVIRLSLGPRILRADTAAISALTILQTVRGDWR